MRKGVYTLTSTIFILTLIIGVTYASFTDEAKILGATFSVGSADLKLLEDVAGGVDSENLVDEMAGPTFSDVGPYWNKDYSVKLYNNSLSEVFLTTNAFYETANDLDNLRQEIFVEPFEWDDLDSDGVVDEGELAETSLGEKTIVKWKTEGIEIGNLATGDVKGLVLRFTTDTIPDSKQGASALFDFEFNSVGME